MCGCGDLKMVMSFFTGGGNMIREIEELQKIIDTHRKIVFFFFFFVSTESGIPDFRSQDGLYNLKYK